MFIYWLYYTSRLHRHQLKLPQITKLNLSLCFELKFMQSSFKDWVDWFGNFGEGGAGFEPIGKHCFRINKGKMRTWKVCQIYKIKLPKVGIGTHLPLPRSTESAHVSFLFHQRSTLQIKIVGHLKNTANLNYIRMLILGRRSSVDMTELL